MKYKLAIFDMDGTILNTIEDLCDATNYTLSLYGMPTHTIDEVKFFVGNGILTLLSRAVPKGTDEETVKKLYETFLPYYQKHCQDKTKPYDGIVELIQILKAAGCKTAVVSNKTDIAVKELANTYFPNLFDIAIGENEAAGIAKKPAPDEVDLALNALGIDRKDSVYIGDSNVDVETAKNSMMDLIAVDWGFRSHSFLVEMGVSTIVSTPTEILNIILSE